MRFTVGYRMPDEGDPSFVEMLADYRQHIAEVYFPWAGTASGRSPLGRERGRHEWSAQERLENDLTELASMGFALDLILNANCLGGMAMSKELESETVSIIERVGEVAGRLDVVTTASPAIARMIKNNFP